MQPSVSVIIPNYNHAPYLEQRINSVLNQTYQNFEVIILDDCSTDNSKEIIEQYRNHPKISEIIFNEANSGSTFKQWDKGIALAKGDWIWIAESDDWCEASLLENLTLLIQENIGLAYCQSLFTNSSDNTLSPYRSTSCITEVISKDTYIEKKLVPFSTLVNASMAIFRKDLYYKISKEYTQYKLAGDWIFWAEISRLADVVISGKFLNYFRQHSIKVSYNTKKNGLNYPEEIKALLFFKTNLGLDNNLYEEALLKHYTRFRYDRFPFNKGVIEKTDAAFQESFSNSLKKKVKKQLLKDKLNYKFTTLLNKLIK